MEICEKMLLVNGVIRCGINWTICDVNDCPNYIVVDRPIRIARTD